jgi:serine/threonine-protein kinase
MTAPVLTKHCTRCGGEFPDEALFCPMCGEAQARSVDDPLLGKVLAERYLLQARMGQGASGTVYRAEHVTLRRKAAVKILHHQLSTDDAAIERFRREATTVTAIENEHILEVLDFGRAEDGRLYFAMELLDGETLAAVLQRDGRLPVARAVEILAQVGEALMEAHGMGYVHRDLRPRNIFLTRKHGRDDFVKLLDFGLAKLIHPDGEAHQTTLGMTFGDPRYMSPEQARGVAVDRRADIYSLGIIGYEMMTGEPPFSGGPPFQLLTRQIEEAPRTPSTVQPGLPPYVDQVLLTALAKKPEERFVTVLRMIEALREGAAASAAQTPRPGPRATPWPPQPGLRPHEYPAAPEPRPAAPPPAAPRAAAPAAPPAAAPAPARAAAAEPATGRTLTYMPKAGATGERGAVGLGAAAAPPPARSSGVAAAVAESPSEASYGTATLPASGATPPPASMSRQWFAEGDAPPEATSGAGLSRTSLTTPRDPYARRAVWAVVGLVAIGLAVGAIYLWVGRDGPPAPAPPAPVIAPTAGDAGVVLARPAPAAAAAGRAVARDAAPVMAPAVTPRAPVVAKAAEPKPREPKPREPKPREPEPAPEPERPTPAGVDPAVVQQHLGAARDALRRGAHAQAAAEFLAVRELDPRNADAIAGLGEVAFEQGHYQEATVHLKAALRLQPRRPGFHVLLGDAYYKLGKTRDAVAAYRAALKIQPNNEAARHALQVAEDRLKEEK